MKVLQKVQKKVVEQNFGDCDDKSNLLISLLKVKDYEAYFVLVPNHIFVIINLEGINLNKKALYVNNKKILYLGNNCNKFKNSFSF